MPIKLKSHALDFKTQYGLGFHPQDDEIVVDFFCGGGGGAGTGLEMGLGRKVTVGKNHNPAATSMHPPYPAERLGRLASKESKLKSIIHFPWKPEIKLSG